MRLTKICDCESSCDHHLHYAFKHKGQLHRGTTHTANSVLARRVADKVRQNVIAHGVGLPANWQAPLLSTHIAAYLAAQRGAFPRTASRDARVLTGFLLVVGDRRLTEIGTFEIERWRTARSKTVSRSTVERDEHAVRGCFTDAETRYAAHAFVSPCRKIAPWKVEGILRRALSLPEIVAALDGLPHRLALIARVTLECLPRLSEVLGLREVDLGPGRLSFRRKGGAVTTIQADPALVADLRAELAPGQEYIFGDPTAKEREDLVAWLIAAQGRTSVAFARAFRALGLHGVSHHVMRHTGVTLMLERGVNPREIQKLAGWSTLRMLEKYGHVRDEAQRTAVMGNAALIAAARKDGVPSGSRTRVSGLKGQRPGPLDDGDK